MNKIKENGFLWCNTVKWQQLLLAIHWYLMYSRFTSFKFWLSITDHERGEGKREKKLHRPTNISIYKEFFSFEIIKEAIDTFSILNIKFNGSIISTNIVSLKAHTFIICTWALHTKKFANWNMWPQQKKKSNKFTHTFAHFIDQLQSNQNRSTMFAYPIFTILI